MLFLSPKHNMIFTGNINKHKSNCLASISQVKVRIQQVMTFLEGRVKRIIYNKIVDQDRGKVHKSTVSWRSVNDREKDQAAEESEFVCARGFTFLVWPRLLTRSLRVQTGNMFIPGMFRRHSTYGKLSWSRDVKRTTSLNQAHMKWFVNGVSSLTMMEASAKAETIKTWSNIHTNHSHVWDSIPHTV
jgi:hypothetical protein